MRFSLRTLFLVVLLAAIACFFVRQRLIRLSEMEAAAKAITDVNGTVMWAHQYDASGGFIGGDTLPWEDMLGQGLAKFFFLEPYAVHSRLYDGKFFQSPFRASPRDAELGNTQLAAAKSLREIVVLDLTVSHVTSEGLVGVSELKHLRELSLSKCVIDDSAMVHVAQCKRLEILNLDRTQVSDEGLKQLAAIDSLRAILISGTLITKEGIAEFEAMRPDVLVR